MAQMKELHCYEKGTCNEDHGHCKLQLVEMDSPTPAWPKMCDSIPIMEQLMK